MDQTDSPTKQPLCDEAQTLTLNDLRDLASHRIVRRGLNYAGAGRVDDIVVFKQGLRAQVVGYGSEPYCVELHYDGRQFRSKCSCPFDWEPFCKHAIAVLAVHFKLTNSFVRVDAASAAEQEELEIRRRRGRAANFKIRKLQGGRFLGVYCVGSPSGRSYDVEIRSLSETVNSCSCPDHAASMLGTCKHIEAVLQSLRRRAPREFECAAAEPPDIGQVLADYTDTPRIRLLMPPRPTPALVRLAQAYFDGAGFFRKDPVAGFSEFLQRARRLGKLVVYDDAVDLSAAIENERRGQARRHAVHEAVLRGGPRPGSIRTDLYPFQLAGTAFLAAAGRALLADEMGLGKTIQAIAAARILAERNEVRRVLVVCPASLKAQWSQEIKRFTGLRCQVVSGTPGNRLVQYRRDAPFTIVNYELVLRDRRGIAKLAPDLLILDEAQRIRNWRTKTATAIKDIATRFAFVLTGTALQNRLDDLYSIMQVVDHRLLGPLWAYNEAFVVRAETGSKILGYRNLDELRRRLAPRVLRREMSEVKLQIPERIDSRLAVPMTPVQRGLMDEGVMNAARLAKTAEKRPLSPDELKRMMSAMQMARMSCNAAGLVDKETVGSPKLAEFDQLIADVCLGNNRKVVVFSEWIRFCDMAAACADRRGIGYVRLDGSVPSPQRGGLIATFRDDPACQIFFSTDAGGVGLNLQFASVVINLDMPWNPAVLDQRIGRVHRQGQQEPVHVFILVAEDSFENSLERTIAAKRGIFSAALDQRSQVDVVDGPASCLHIIGDVLTDMGVADAGEVDEQNAVQRATTLAGSLGSRLGRVVLLHTGQLVALVDKLDDMVTRAVEQQGMVAMETSVADSLAVLGEASPFSKVEVIHDGAVTTSDTAREQRVPRFNLAQRKLKAASTLAVAGLGAEALAQASSAMLAAACSAACTAVKVIEIDDEMPTARLLFEVLVTRDVLDLEQAAIIARADGLARAYAETTEPVPEETVSRVLTDAEGLVAWARPADGQPRRLL